MVAVFPSSERGNSTRVAILQAAEHVFAEQGFDRARLEDVASEVGIRRASIVYYFRDKRELYHTVLADMFADYAVALESALFGPGDVVERMEAAVVGWVDFVAARPTFARVLLRELADAGGDGLPAMLEHRSEVQKIVERFETENSGDPLLSRIDVEPAHMVASVAGATLFLFVAMPALMPSGDFDPLEPAQVEAHRNEVLRTARRLMGTGVTVRTRPARAERPAKPRRSK